MERFLKRRLSGESSTPNPQPQAVDEGERIKLGPSLEKRFLKLDLEQLQNDPGLRPRMSDYHAEYGCSHYGDTQSFEVRWKD